jgi:hypothetical protein
VGKIIFPHLKDYGKLPDWWHPAFSAIISPQALSITVSQFLLLAIALKTSLIIYIYLYNYIYLNIYKRVLAGLGQ